MREHFSIDLNKVREVVSHADSGGEQGSGKSRKARCECMQNELPDLQEPVWLEWGKEKWEEMSSGELPSGSPQPLLQLLYLS